MRARESPRRHREDVDGVLFWCLPALCARSRKEPMDVLAFHAARQPDKPALIEGVRVWSWPEILTLRNRLGPDLLEIGFWPGAHVLGYSENSFDDYPPTT